MAGAYDFTGSQKVNHGETTPRVVTWQTGSPPANVNLTGYTAALVISGIPDGAVVATLTDSSGGITLGGVAGTIALNFGVLTGLLPTGRFYAYALTLTSPTGISKRLLEGQLEYSL